MTSKIIDMGRVPNIIGPESTGNCVIVDGRLIPKLRCYEHENQIEFVLDDRFSFTFPKELAYLAAAFAAQALALGEGYPSMHALNKEMPFAPEVMFIDTTL